MLQYAKVWLKEYLDEQRDNPSWAKLDDDDEARTRHMESSGDEVTLMR